MVSKPQLTAIIGPTASGKTDYAVRLAHQLNGAVLSADSRQLYTEMNIGTAKPEAAWADKPHDILVSDDIDGIPHYLFNIRRPDDPITLSEWQTAAFQAIDHVIASGKHPILVGGTMLYIDSVIFNYDIPIVIPNQELRAALEAKSVEALYAQLKEQDSRATTFIQPRNKRRIIRALEVMEGTGKTFSQLRRKRKPKYDFEITGLFPGRDELRQRITKRVDHMLAHGLLEEIAKLVETYGADLPLLKTMNYTETTALLKQVMDKKEARTTMIRANWRYARRQMSWWRGRKDIHWITMASIQFPEEHTPRTPRTP